MSRALQNLGKTCGVMLLWVGGIVALAAALAFANDTPQDVTQERVATLEANNFYNVSDCGTGQYVFTQLIFRDEDSSIIAWRMLHPYPREVTEAEREEQAINHWQAQQGLDPIPFPCRAKFSETRLPALAPRFDHAKKVWVCMWFDGDVLRRVEAISFIETFTEFDPEVDERTLLPNGARRELRK